MKEAQTVSICVSRGSEKVQKQIGSTQVQAEFRKRRNGKEDMHQVPRGKRIARFAPFVALKLVQDWMTGFRHGSGGVQASREAASAVWIEVERDECDADKLKERS